MLAVVEQVVAPGDRATQRLLPLRQVARAGRQQGEVVLEPGEDLVRRQELDPRGGELDRQRHAVQPGAIPATAGAFALVTAKPGLTAPARAMNSRTASYWLSVSRSNSRTRARQVQPVDLREAARVGRGGQAGDRVLLLAGDPQRDRAS